MDLEHAVQQLRDEQAVTRLLHDYCLAFDDNRPQDVGALFTDDAVVDYGPETDTIVGASSIAFTIAVGLTETFAATSHHVSNVQVALELPDSARSTCYLYAWHRYVDGSPDGELWGRYRHRFRRTPSGWRIAALRLEVAGAVDFHRATTHPTGRRRS